MSKFTTRVELHDAVYSDYERLHQFMENRGFARIIQADTGHWYRLPTAEYDIDTESPIEMVHDAAQSAANQTGRQNSVFVSLAPRRRWSGLELVR